MSEVKFIRVGGRIIPIRKNFKEKKGAEHLSKVDAAAGVIGGASLTGILKVKSQKFMWAGLGASTALSIFAGIRRSQIYGNDTTGKVNSQLKGNRAGALGFGAGALAGIGGVVAANNRGVRNFTMKTGSKLGDLVHSLKSKASGPMKKTFDLSKSKVKTFKAKGRRLDKIQGLLR